jgi:4-hydroxy-tetrahydrodipicolinate synthase
MREIIGCGTALITPFKADGSLDLPALRRFVEWQIEEGVHFLVPCGTTGESVTMSLAEQVEVVGTVVEVARGRVPVVAGAGSNDTHKVIETIRAFEPLGVDGYLSVGPYYNKPTQEGFYQHFRAIARATARPIIVYNVPGRTGSNILPDTLARLASDCPNIVGVKEASGDVGQFGDVLLKAPPGFKLFSGDDALTLPAIALGGVGIISVASNEAPRDMSRMTRAALDGDWETARALNRKLWALMKANFLESNPIPVKTGVALIGRIPAAHYRLPMVPPSPATREKLRAVLADLGLVPEPAGVG